MLTISEEGGGALKKLLIEYLTHHYTRTLQEISSSSLIPLTLRWICPRLLVSDQSSCAFRHDELVSVLSSNQRHQRPYFNNLELYTLNCPPPTVTVKKNESYTFGNSCVPLLNLHPTLHIDLHFTLVQRVLLSRTVVFPCGTSIPPYTLHPLCSL